MDDTEAQGDGGQDLEPPAEHLEGQDGEPTEAEPQERKTEPLTAAQTLAAPVVVPRWVQLVLLPLAIVGFYQLARATGSLVAILIGATVLAVILNPLVKQLRRVFPHGLAILFAWVIVWLVMGLLALVLSQPVANQVDHFSSTFPHWVHKTNHFLDNLQSFLHQHGIKVQIAHQGQSALQSLERKVLKSSGTIVSFSSDVLGRALTLSVDLVLTFVLSVYFIAYSAKIGQLVRRIMPPGDGSDRDDFPLLIQKSVSGYVRGQLLFSFVMGFSCALMLWILGVTGVFPDGSRFAVFFGIFYGLMELIPYIGPIIGAIPPILVALITDPISALWLLIAFVGLQQLEGHIVAPQLFRISLRINPILVILALLVGERLFGIAGALLALPVATMIRQTILYLRAHLVLEPWNQNDPLT